MQKLRCVKFGNISITLYLLSLIVIVTFEEPISEKFVFRGKIAFSFTWLFMKDFSLAMIHLARNDWIYDGF